MKRVISTHLLERSSSLTRLVVDGREKKCRHVPLIKRECVDLFWESAIDNPYSCVCVCGEKTFTIGLWKFLYSHEFTVRDLHIRRVLGLQSESASY